MREIVVKKIKNPCECPQEKNISPPPLRKFENLSAPCSSIDRLHAHCSSKRSELQARLHTQLSVHWHLNLLPTKERKPPLLHNACITAHVCSQRIRAADGIVLLLLQHGAAIQSPQRVQSAECLHCHCCWYILTRTYVSPLRSNRHVMQSPNHI
jgi:hypothetical protein